MIFWDTSAIVPLIVAEPLSSSAQELAKTDPDILSIQMSSGLSGTVNAATAGAAMVPEANVLPAVTSWQTGISMNLNRCSSTDLSRSMPMAVAAPLPSWRT